LTYIVADALTNKIIFELCAETLPACMAAEPGGADRIELCTSLEVGGLTPDRPLIEQAIQQCGLPVHVLVRPHANGYNYSAAYFDLICSDIEFIRNAGASGVVVGALRADNTIDIKRTAALVDLAGQMEVTFHRAFDATPNIDAALEDVIFAGCRRILTSGGQPDVFTGAQSLAHLVSLAEGRIAIAAGGGLRLENARAVRYITGAHHFHSSVTSRVESGPALIENIRKLVHCLQQA
jgi:copper homeostasis protein